jgi:beta-galactosidase/beta-glucuronidase
LNGTWEFDFDDDNQGLQNGWRDGRQLSRRIIVPFPYQCELSGINDKQVHEVVWYARSFTVPTEWRGNDIMLHFGAVDYLTTVWVNGEEVGHNQGGHIPFWFDIAPYLQEGENRLTMRVEDSQDPYQPRGKQSTSGLPREIDYYCTTGIWQTVWLEPTPPVRIQELRITPYVGKDAFELSIYLHAPFGAWRLEAEAFDNNEVVAKASEEITSAAGTLTLTIPEAKLWSPESPNLYELRIRLFEGERLLDEVESYAGLRSIELRKGRVYLNGQSTYLMMVLDQGYWPESYLAAPSDEAIRADVEWVKRFGFNGVRKHQKVEDPRWLYWCDRLGLLVWGEMPNARAWSAKAEERLVAEWRRVIRRDYNHPCIITWVPVNESWGFPGLQENQPAQYAFLERMVAITRRLDPKRPIIDNDGWEHSDVTDICAIHDYTATSEGLKARYEQKLSGGSLPPNLWLSHKPLFLRGSSYRGQPIMLTEVGGFLMIPEGIPEQDRDILYKFYGSCCNADELLEKYRDLMSGVSSLTFVAGFCYTQLTDIEQEINGLLTYDRKPKVAPKQLSEIHRSMILHKDEVG